MDNKRAVAVLSGGLRKENGQWRTTNFNDSGDGFGTLGDRLRVVAGSHLHKNDPELFLIASGGRGQYKDFEDVPNLCAVIKKELIELGVPEEKIIEEADSSNTYEQLRELSKIILEEQFDNLSIISNEYHLPRIRAMIDQDAESSRLLVNGQLKLQSAEEILLYYEPEVWKEMIECAYKSEAMQERIALEQKGVREIKEGTYKYKRYE